MRGAASLPSGSKNREPLRRDTVNRWVSRLAGRWVGRLAAAMVALAAIGFSAPAPVAGQESVDGRWIFSIEAPDSAGAIQIPFVFEQDGSSVTGRPDVSIFPQVQAAEISEGTFQEGVLSFQLRVGAGEEWVTIQVEAEVDGDTMTGEARIPGFEQTSTFSAERAPPPG